MASFLWGLAEATVFFVVPDVLISRIALNRGFRRGVRSAVAALIGAMCGGVLMHRWGAKHPNEMRLLMIQLPGVDRAMTDSVSDEVAEEGPRALLRGPRSGRPYKLYALESGAGGQPISSLLLWTVPGRLVRFLISAGGGAWGRRFASPATRNRSHALFWVVFYAWFWGRTAKRGDGLRLGRNGFDSRCHSDPRPR